ncbi:type II toxin-antitoxin system RelB/DinJ family antitoxin [Candidatus Peribacteria bacterium]|jgi:DNA-damage-inducible protein J|nr:type II toxin-antitoxin system RelB/DinJ family antitoxin [Candidatus Peribacteria bacterium]MBT4021463.1 type II toxin-antitoxin system RelB/DinJ family antitoxin [Candidatus Peribacteria bacterium]MBT4240373.1 type II toxin-antitoxin system RelB/DinJ family antitoxin [Candidatus Peribacteria bacterium]MBT4473796.1 type II toxin-antitoxin system RelB/DinJ family antitoxin [Candidatus Peribacteria bacterium]
MAQKGIQVRIDEDLKKKAERILKSLGLDVPTAVRVFFKQITIQGGLPFEIKDNGYYDYTPEEMKEIEKAYDESFDEKNLSPAFDSTEEAIAYLESEDEN